MALRGLGGRGGGLRSDEAAELERLSRREVSQDARVRARVDVSVHGAGLGVAVLDSAPKQDASRCKMLMAKERPDPESDAVWRCLTCEDEDDFVAFTKLRCSFFGEGGTLLWEAGDPVLLWDADEVDVPFGGGAERFQRFAVVSSAEAAGADKARVKRDRPLVPNPKHNLPIASDHGGARRSKVILKVVAETGLDAIPEVHVELPVGDAGGCRVVRMPWARRSAHRTRSSRLNTAISLKCPWRSAG